MSHYRVNYYKNLLSSDGHQFKCLQQQISGRRSRRHSHQNITGSLSTATVAALWWTWTCA